MADSEAVLAQLAPPAVGRDHRHRRERERSGARDRDRGGHDPRLSLLDLGNVSAPKSKSVAGRKSRGPDHDSREGRGQRSRDGRLHFDGVRKSVSGPLEHRAPRRSRARDRRARSRRDFSGGHGRRRRREFDPKGRDCRVPKELATRRSESTCTARKRKPRPKSWLHTMPAAAGSTRRSAASADARLPRIRWSETSRPRKSFTPSSSAGCDRPSPAISVKSRD